MKQSVPKTTFLLILLTTAIISFLVFLYANSAKTPSPTSLSNSKQGDNVNTYTSQDLKIAFQYPKTWYVDEKDFNIMIASYMTKIGENKSPSRNEIKIFIDNYSGCFPTLEQDLIEPACGQGKAKNKIISKDIKQTPNGEFLKYTLDSYDENQRVQYFFQKGDEILDIEIHPDPSEFEKEFEDLVNSIRFID